MRRLLSLLVLLLATAPEAEAKPKPRPAAKRKPIPSPPPVAAAADLAPVKDTAEAIARLQRYYDATVDLHVKFEQDVESGLGVKKRASGDLWVKKPGKMRWEYQKPEKKLMVADGQTLWVYEPEDEQAFKQDLKSSALPSSVTFLWGSGRLGDEFTVTLEAAAGLGGPGDIVLKLVPKQATAQYRYLMFVADGRSAMVKETVVFDQQGGRNHMIFRDPEQNRGVADGKFSFTPPPGTRIIR